MNNDKGFSLLEILVAFSILAISLGILLKIFSSGVNTAIIAEEYTIATQIAESLMAKSSIEEQLVEGEKSGTENETYQWSVTIESFPNPVDDNETEIELFNVQVVVQWDTDALNARQVELNTVKIGSKQ